MRGLLAWATVLSFGVPACGGTTTSIPGAGLDAGAQADGLAADGGNPSATIGSPCAQNSECPVLCVFGDCTPLCLNEPPFTGGYCSRSIGECPAPGGSDAGSSPCPAGTFCANGQPAINETNGDYCLAGCMSDGECRTDQGYKCCAGLTHADQSVCVPATLCH